MNNLNLEKYLNIVNEEKARRGLDNYIALYPMLRVYNNILYVCVALTNEDNNVCEINNKIKPDYWVLIDVETEKIIEFNNTKEKDFVIGNEILKNVENKQKEISKYALEKTMDYKNYLIEDIKNEKLPFQKKLSSLLGDEMKINGDLVNINDYLLANLEEDIKNKINELVDILIHSKYSSITIYYDMLFANIVETYKMNNTIDIDKIQVCVEIMNN